MKKDLIARLLCLVISVFLISSVVGCTASEKKKTENPSSKPADTSSSNTGDNTEPDDSTDNIDDSLTPDEGDIDYEDQTGDDYYDDFEETEEEENVFYDDLTVNNAKPLYKNFMGLNGIYQCYTYMPDINNRTYTEKQAQLEFDRIGQMGMSVVRTYYGSKYAWDTKTGSFNWDSEHMNAIYKWAKEMEKRDLDIALNAGWAIEAMVTGDSWDPAPGIYVDGDFAQTCKNYGKFMVDSVKEMKARGINNVEYLMLFTEPGYAYEGENGNPDYAHVTIDKNIWELEAPVFDEWLDLTKAMDKAFKDAGIRKDYQFVGPNESAWTATANGTYYRPMFYQAVTQANDYIDVFSHHYYIETQDQSNDVTNEFCDTYYKDRAELVREKTGKPFWIDEFNVRDYSVNSEIGGPIKTMSNMFHTMHIATAVSSGMRLGIQNMMLWTLADQLWPDNTQYSNEFVDGVQVLGVLPSLFQTSVPRKSYYGISLLTKYLGHNATVYETSSGFTTAGFQQDENGDYTLLVINSNTVETTKLTVNFEKSLGTKTLYRHVYNPTTQKATQEAKLIGADKAIKFAGSVLTDTIEANSVVIYTTRKD